MSSGEDQCRASVATNGGPTPRRDRRDVLALALPSPDLDAIIDPDHVVVTAHAVVRYRERVENVVRRIAVRQLERLVATAQWRTRPQPWTGIVLHPEVLYGYSPVRPDVCLLLRRRRAVVTVFSQRFLASGRMISHQVTDDRTGRHRRGGRYAPGRRHPEPLHRCRRAAH